MSQPRAYLVDSSIYIFRAWHVYDSRLSDSEGRPVNAVYGFGEFLWQLIQQKRPSLLACAFDASQTNSWRRELYPEYKANRDPAPPELKRQFGLCQDFCRSVGIAEFSSDRYEADDIIGTLATRLRADGYAITIVSADKDLTQLVTGDEDAWWDFARGTVLNHRGVEKQFGVKPHQIADLLAISGDKVDNIIGVPGIGYKLASKLLKKYTCIDNLLDNLHRVGDMQFRGSARIQMLLEKHRDLLPLNRALTRIATDMTLETGDLAPKGLDQPGFDALIDSLGLNEHYRRRWYGLPYNNPQ